MTKCGFYDISADGTSLRCCFGSCCTGNMCRFVLLISADGALMPVVCLVGGPLGLVVVSRELAVLLTADGTGCFFLAGCRAARVVGRLLAADIAVVILVCVYVRRLILLISAYGALMPVVCLVG